MTTKVIIFNGPPRSGKDTSAAISMRFLESIGKDSFFYRFAFPLKQATHALFGIKTPLDNSEYFDNCKDLPNEAFLGGTPRQAYINMSEKMVKPFYGKYFFGRVAIKSIEKMKQGVSDPVIVTPDGGFDIEVDCLAKAYGSENILVVHLYRDGTSFANDSRSYVKIPGVPFAMLKNNGTLSDLEQSVHTVLKEFLNASV